mmetsp:Transcript_11203/g.41052  ORF Transcript_11203/g.41052 Transcript_11203/m.41052 type:complete len:264 (-) Transcript_11203:76-867(-)
MASVQTVAQKHEQFKKALVSNAFDKCEQILDELKELLVQFPSLPPIFEQTPTQKQELLLARDILEHAVLLSAKQHDDVGFARHYAQLRTYYVDTAHLLPQSEQEYPITGLNLLRLVALNRIAEFHTELELISVQAQGNVYVKYSLELERCLMEGAYSKLLQLRGQVPTPVYSYFTELLVEAVKKELASCTEKAYRSLSVTDAMKVLMCSNETELRTLAEEHGWQITNGQVTFGLANDSCKAEIAAFPTIQKTLGYAKELERIV